MDRTRICRLGTLLNQVGANAAAASRTATIDLSELRIRRLCGTVTLSHSAATSLTLQVKLSADGGTTYALVQSQQIAAGTATLSDYLQSKAVSGDDGFAFHVDCEGFTHAQLIVAAPSGGGLDVITLIGSGVQ